MTDPKLDLSRVSREALEALARYALEWPLLAPVKELTRIRAEATAEEPKPVKCELCGMVTPAGLHSQLHHVGCGIGAPTVSKPLRDQPPPRTRAPDDFRTMLREMAQSWRDEAFGGQHCSELRSNILEECADELTAALDSPAPAPTTEHERAVLEACGKLTKSAVERAEGIHPSLDALLLAAIEMVARRAAEKESKL